jgi:signal peptidase
MKSFFRKVLKVLSVSTTVLLFVCMVVLLCMVIMTQVTGEKQLFGYQIKTVLSGSMEPEIKTGSIILVKEIEDKTSLQVGDVITFYQSFDRVVTHRIVEVIHSGEEVLYRTKGDNNPDPDMTLVLSDNVLAKYTGITIPYLGYVAQYANTTVGIFLLLVIPGVILLCYSIIQFYLAFQESKKQKKSKPMEESHGTNQETLPYTEKDTLNI